MQVQLDKLMIDQLKRIRGAHRKLHTGMTMGCTDELYDLLCHSGDVIGILHIGAGYILGDIQPGVVLIVKGRITGELGHTVLIQTPTDS